MRKILTVSLFAFFHLIAFQSTAQMLTSTTLPTGAGRATKIIQYAPNRFLIVGKGNFYAYALQVNRMGQTVKFKKFKTEIGGTKSEFTDVIQTPTGFIFAGDVDDLVNPTTGQTVRRMFLMKTKLDLTIEKIVRYDPPTGTPANVGFWGHQKIKQAGASYIVTSQLFSGTNINDFRSDFALLSVTDNLATNYYRYYDYHLVDGIGDVEVANNSLYVLGWGIFGYFVGADSTFLWRFDPANGDLLKESVYSGAGFTLTSAPNGDLYIGGAKSVSFANPADGWLLRVNANGDILNESTFGTSNTDAIRDIHVLANGNVITSGSYDQVCPPSFNPSDPTTWEYAQTSRVWYFSNTFSTFNCFLFYTMPNPNLRDLVVHTLLPLNKDGSEFVAVGYLGNKSVWYSLSSQINDFGSLPTEDRGEQATEPKFAIFPNLLAAGQNFNVQAGEAASNFSVEVFESNGRLVSRQKFVETAQADLRAPLSAGVYLVRMTDDAGQTRVQRLVVQR